MFFSFKLMRVVYSIYTDVKKAPSLFRGLSDRMKEKGWKIIYYGDGGPGDDMLDTLGLSQYKSRLKSFSFSGAVQVIGIRNNLSDLEKLNALAHEIGHIECGHDLQNLTSEDEEQANYFANSLLGYKRRKPYILCIALLVFSILFMTIISGFAKPSQYSIYSIFHYISTSAQSIEQDYEMSPTTIKVLPPTASASNVPPADVKNLVYITASGEKYHLATCRYVENNKTARSLTIEEARDQGKTPCKVCRPDIVPVS